jgi:hypothetical protein
VDKLFKVTLHTRHRFDSPEKAAELFAFFNESGGVFKPARFGTTRSVRKPYDPADVSEPMALLSHPPDYKGGAVMLKGAKYRFLAWIISGMEEVNVWSMWLDAKFFARAGRVEEFTRFISALCERFPILFGSACTQEDWDAKHWVDTDSGLTKTGSTLNKCLPGVYWLTVLGRPLVEHFGREKIEGLPVHRVLDFGRRGGLGLVLRESPLQPEESERLSHDAEIARLLGEEYFFDPARPDRPCQPVPSVTEGGVEIDEDEDADESQSESAPAATSASAPQFTTEELEDVTVLDATGDPVTDLKELAEMLVVFLQGEVNEAGDYSRAALEAIDEHFAKHPQRKEYKPEHLNKEFLPALGAYLGEVLVRNVKAKWVEREPLPKSTVKHGDTEVSPFEVAYRSVYEGAKLADAFDRLARLPSS